MRQRLVIVVILTFNQEELTSRCLKSFKEVTYPCMEIVVIDNDSKDDTEINIKREFPKIHFIKSPVNKGVAGGRNLGIQYAERCFDYDYILIIDNDTVVERDFLYLLVQELESDHTAGIATPKIYKLDEKNVIDEVGGTLVNFFTGSTLRMAHGEIDKGQYDIYQNIPNTVPSGCCCLIRRKVIIDCIGYEEFFYPYGFEDLDFSLRAKIKGYSFCFVPESTIYHLGSKTSFSGYSLRYAEIKGRNLKFFMKRHCTKKQWICFNILLPILGLKTLFREIAKGNPLSVFKLAIGYLKR